MCSSSLQASQFLTEDLAIIMNTASVHDSERRHGSDLFKAISNQKHMGTNYAGFHLGRGAQIPAVC